MKVLYITYDGVTEPIGQSQVLSYLKELAKKNITFHLISFEKHNIRGTRYAVRSTSLEKLGIKWHPLKYHKRPRALATLFDVIAGTLKALNIAKKEKIDVIHARSYVAALIAWITGSLKKTKFIFDMRGFWPDERVDAGLLRKNSLSYGVIKKFEKIFIKKADKIVTLTHKAKKILISDFDVQADKIIVIPCCADMFIFGFSQEARDRVRKELGISDKKVFIHTGSVIGWYMLGDMLKWFKAIKELEHEAFFMFISQETNKDIIFDTARNVGVRRSDILIKEVFFKDMPQYLSAADVGLFFIKPVFSKKASSPVKLAEYLACEVPVICNSGVGDLDDIVEKEKVGALVKKMDADSFKNAYSLLNTLSRETDIKGRCRNVAEKLFSLEKGAEAYLRIYSPS